MPRGWTTADVSVVMLEDRKLARLRHEAPDEGEGAIRSMLYVGLVLASWRDGERIPLAELSGVYTVSTERFEALRDVGLVDDKGRIPAKSWTGWNGPAEARRDQRRAAGKLGNESRWHRERDTERDSERMPDGIAASVNNRERIANGIPVRPSVRPTKDGTDGRSTPARAPASAPAREAPDAEHVPGCLDYSAHRTSHRWWPGIGWKCDICEKAKADADNDAGLSFREKVERAAARTHPEDPY